eukprot:3528394-Amphidinium_carterae.1
MENEATEEYLRAPSLSHVQGQARQVGHGNADACCGIWGQCQSHHRSCRADPSHLNNLLLQCRRCTQSCYLRGIQILGLTPSLPQRLRNAASTPAKVRANPNS